MPAQGLRSLKEISEWYGILEADYHAQQLPL